MKTFKNYILFNQSQVSVDMEQITSPDEVSKVIHGTNFKAWNEIQRTGLNKMKRNHIHFAAGEPGSEGVISGMRSTAQVTSIRKLRYSH